MKAWLEKHKNILDFSLAALWRRRGKNAALLLVYAGLVFSLGSVIFYTQAIKQEAAFLLASTGEILVQRMMAGRHDPIPLDYAEKIRKIRGVADVSGRRWGYYYDPVTRANYTLIGSDQLGLEENRIIVGAEVARLLGARPGRTIRVRNVEGKFMSLQIKGILDSDSALISADLMLLTEADWQKIFGTPANMATDLVVRVRNQKEVPTIAGKITELFPDVRVLTRAEILRTYDALFDWRSGLVLMVLSGAALAFAILAWDKASGLSADEQREIGILKALGWDTAEVLEWKTWEGLAISLSAFLIGVLAAYIHVFFLQAPLLAPIFKGWSVLYPRFRLTPFLSLAQLVILFFFTVIPYTVATVIPVWRAATLDPDQINRS